MSLSMYYNIDFKRDLQWTVNDGEADNMDNDISIYSNTINYNDEYYEAHNIVVSIKNDESITYQTYNDIVCNTDISDIVDINGSGIDTNDRYHQ